MILSRLAETIYWMARYIERAENTARIIMVNANLLMDLPKGIAPGWDPIISITGSTTLFKEQYSELTERNVVKFLLTDKSNPGSILNSLANARENLRTTRAIIPRGAWESLNDLYHFTDEHKAKGQSRKGRFEYLTHIIRSCQLITGNTSSSMSHDRTYEFIRLGRYLERADMVTRVLEACAGNLLPKVGEGLKPFDDIQWKSILESLAAFQMYRRHVHVRVKESAVLGYLLQDNEFPRSISYCANELERSLRALPYNEAALRTLGRLQRTVKETDVSKINRQQLNDYMNELQIILGQVHTQLEAVYFQSERHKKKALMGAESVTVKAEDVAA